MSKLSILSPFEIDSESLSCFLNRLPQSISYCRNDLRPQPGPLSYWMIWQLTAVRECQRRNAIGFLHKKHKPQQKQRLEICKGEEHVSESTVCSTAKGATYLAPLYGLFFGLGSICPFYIPRIRVAIRRRIARPIHSPDGSGPVHLGSGKVRSLYRWRGKPGKLAAYFSQRCNADCFG
jgi:hypothetical protein